MGQVPRSALFDLGRQKIKVEVAQLSRHLFGDEGVVGSEQAPVEWPAGSAGDETCGKDGNAPQASPAALRMTAS